MSAVKKILLMIFAFALGCVWAAGGMFYYQASQPAGEDSKAHIFVIQPGQTLKQTARTLSQRGLIRSPNAFILLAYLRKKQNQIQAGEYEISPAMLPREILRKIASGQTVKYSVTVPEGYSLREIASLLEQRGLADKDEFMAVARDRQLTGPLGIAGDSLEGYLFPETYHISRTTSETAIVKAMIELFKDRVLTPENLERARELGLDFYQAVTLASLIEKETGLDAERKLISSVFHNRLRKKMPLQTDPTVIYALRENFDGNIRKKDLSVDSPYNTYKHIGLPPGPIASPGLKSVIAALYPAQTDYLYFVSRQDGSHQFSANLIDHNRAVAEFQLKKPKKS
ncbi:MAG: endolytic transglycosylase MltG [Nitrospinae bacterium]|nr:endolytic transglycosylase MltG [Nitrospinota bacterium]